MSKAKTPVNPLTQNKKRRIGPGVIVVGVLVLALAGGVGVQYWRSNSKVEVSSSGQPEPAVITGPGTSGQGVKVGKEGAKANIDLYVDFRCPHCAQFEEEAGPAIDKLVQDGTATLTYWPMIFVNKESSPRLGNAFAAAAANGKALSYAGEMFKDFTKSWTDDQLLQLAKQLGVDNEDFKAALRDGKYRGWLDSVGQAAEKRGVTGTPTVFVNDKQLDANQLTGDGVKQAVESATATGS